MGDKWHFLVSIFKSFIRIIGSCGAFVGVISYGDAIKGVAVLAISFAIAEVLGIIEEVVDKRK